MSSIPGDSTTTVSLSTGRSYNSDLSYVGDSDWYKVELIAGLDYKFTVRGDGTANSLTGADIRLRDEYGNIIETVTANSSYTSTSLSSSISKTGIYYVDIYEYFGGTGTYTINWVGNDTVKRDTTTTTTLGIKQSIDSALDTNGDSDWYKVNLKAGLDYEFNISGFGKADSLTGSDIKIRDANGNVISSEISSSTSTSNSDAVSISKTGTYFVEVYEYFQATGEYKIQWVGNDTVRRDSATNAVLGAGKTVNGTLDVAGDSDWYKVSLKAGYTYGIQVTGFGTSDSLTGADIKIRDNNGNVVSSELYGDQQTISRDAVLIKETGTYFVEVYEYFGATGRYNLGWIGNDTATNDVKTPATVKEGQSVTSSVDVGGDHDWYALSAIKGTSYLITLSGTGTDALDSLSLVLRDKAGTAISSTWSWSSKAAALNWTAASSSKVYLDASAGSSYDTGSYKISVISSASTLKGSGSQDVINGGDSRTTIYGYGGNDVLYGGGGNDVLIGGAGRDQLKGGSGSDTASYVDAKADVIASLIKPSINTNDARGDRYISIENISGSRFNDKIYGNDISNRLSGANGNDSLFGYSGADTLSGGGGRDRLYGDSEADILYGGSGEDLFGFRSLADSTVSVRGRDRIEDFSRTQHDQIDLHILDANTRVSGDQSFTFLGKAGFSGRAGQLRYVTDGEDSVIYGDVNGDRRADFAIHVSDVTVLKAGDFLL